MKNKCEKCIYCRFVRDMDGGYYVCVNKNYKLSWPEFTGKCTYFIIKSNKRGEKKK